MNRRMLDTNTVSYFLRQNPKVLARFAKLPSTHLCASVVTEGEVRFGLAKRDGGAVRTAAVDAFFASLEVLPWTRATATAYGRFRAELERLGRPLAPLDTMIAAHAWEANAVLVTSDRALLDTPGLTTENWLA